ncbi:hypothetical protein ACFP71_07650 [Oerskovia paurometabola]|uniref:Uncharacterized protein n=1 Tax=Oerskovia paurometabola TaxID=162170 RepID=A0ABW1XAC1_9CELL
MTETRWWKYVQELIAGDTAQDAAAKAGFDKSAFSRWKKGANADAAFALKLARAYHANVLEALVAAGLITEEEAGLKHVEVGKADVLRSISDLELAEEILRRVQAASSPELEEPLDDAHPAVQNVLAKPHEAENVVSGRFGSAGSRRYALDAAALERKTSHLDEAAASEELP